MTQPAQFWFSRNESVGSVMSSNPATESIWFLASVVSFVFCLYRRYVVCLSPSHKKLGRFWFKQINSSHRNYDFLLWVRLGISLAQRKQPLWRVSPRSQTDRAAERKSNGKKAFGPCEEKKGVGSALMATHPNSGVTHHDYTAGRLAHCMSTMVKVAHFPIATVKKVTK